MHKIFKLEKLYFLIFISLFILMMALTYLIQGDIKVGKGFVIREEYIENFFMLLSMVGAYFVFWLYKREVRINLQKIIEEKKQKQTFKERLDEAFKYIGQVNVQIQEVHNILSELKIPENKTELKYLINYIGEKILGIVDVDWVIIRVVDVLTKKTLREKIAMRGKVATIKYKVKNSELINNESLKELTFFSSNFNNLAAKTFFIFPKTKLTREQKVLLNAVVNEMEMIYLIYSTGRRGK